MISPRENLKILSSNRERRVNTRKQYFIRALISEWHAACKCLDWFQRSTNSISTNDIILNIFNRNKKIFIFKYILSVLYYKAMIIFTAGWVLEMFSQTSSERDFVKTFIKSYKDLQFFSTRLICIKYQLFLTPNHLNLS